MIKKTNKYIGLKDITVYTEDNSQTSPDFFVISDFPTELTAGKNSFKISANNNNLVIGSEIAVEVLDDAGNVIYSEITNYNDDSGRRLISIYVYEDSMPGTATVYITGEIKSVPSDYQGFYNIRWKRKVVIDPTKDNYAKGIFKTTPYVTISEISKPYLNQTYASASLIVSESANGIMDVVGRYSVLSGSYFSSEMIGGQITIYPTGSIPIFQGILSGSNIYETTIKKVLNETTCVLSDLYKVYYTPNTAKVSTLEHKYVHFDSSPYEIVFNAKPSYTESQNLFSYANLAIANIDTISGKVNSIKTYIKSDGMIGDYELVSDINLYKGELFVDPSSVNISERKGFFSSANILTYWTGSAKDPSDFGTLVIDNSYINEAINASGSIIEEDGYLIITPIDINNFYEDTEYELKFDYYVQDQTNYNLTINSNMEIYMSGSAFPSVDIIGKKIDEIDIPLSARTSRDNVFNFTTKGGGDGKVVFKINSGNWYLANISIMPSIEKNFSPNYFNILVPIPTVKQKDYLGFKVEYYDGNKNLISETITSQSFFSGSNYYIDGEKNIITGSVFIGNSSGSGIELAGVNSGYIRSVGYAGYNFATQSFGTPGFMLWSGSFILIPENPNEVYSSSYTGVGFEFQGGAPNYHSITFSTTTGILQITGSISALYGDIGNWIITSSGLYKLTDDGNYTGMWSSGSNSGSIRFFSGAPGITYNELTSSMYLVDNTGYFYSKRGNIASWDISENKISSSFMNESASIEIYVSESKKFAGSELQSNDSYGGFYLLESTNGSKITRINYSSGMYLSGSGVVADDIPIFWVRLQNTIDNTFVRNPYFRDGYIFNAYISSAGRIYGYQLETSGSVIADNLILTPFTIPPTAEIDKVKTYVSSSGVSPNRVTIEYSLLPDSTLVIISSCIS